MGVGVGVGDLDVFFIFGFVVLLIDFCFIFYWYGLFYCLDVILMNLLLFVEVKFLIIFIYYDIWKVVFGFDNLFCVIDENELCFSLLILGVGYVVYMEMGDLGVIIIICVVGFSVVWELVFVDFWRRMSK